ncbi:MAG TPA: hypothetical protein VNT42_05165 [Sphingomonas sp.]|nr:hypothetical protein [Sphingomonas sp.]
MLALFTNRIAIVQLSGLAIAALAACNIALPAGLDEAHLSAAILLTSSALSAIVRFGHPGIPGADAKAWWRSRIIWTQIVGASFAILALAGIVPSVDQATMVEVAMAMVGMISMTLGRSIARPIGSPTTTITGTALAIAGALGALMTMGGCGITGLRSGVAAQVSESGVAADFELVSRAIDTGAITRGANADQTLRRLETEYTAVRLIRAAYDRAARGAVSADLEAARETTDRAYIGLRARLRALGQDQYRPGKS